jgi:hypothetical protein
MRLIGLAVARAVSLVLVPRAVNAQQALPKLGDALADIRC